MLFVLIVIKDLYADKLSVRAPGHYPYPTPTQHFYQRPFNFHTHKQNKHMRIIIIRKRMENNQSVQIKIMRIK